LRAHNQTERGVYTRRIISRGGIAVKRRGEGGGGGLARMQRRGL